MAIEFNKEDKEKAIASLQRYVDTELDRPLGGLEADALLRFIAKELAPSVYNAAVREVQQNLMVRVADLDIDCYEKPFEYWEKPDGEHG